MAVPSSKLTPSGRPGPRLEDIPNMYASTADGKPKLEPNGEINNYILHQFPDGYRGYAIDVGASDGVLVNSTFVLEHYHCWRVLSVEANPYMKDLLNQFRLFVKMCAVGSKPADGVDFHINMDNVEALSALEPKRHHPRFIHEDKGRWMTVKINVRTLDQLLEESEFPRLDALCVDVEGGEADVLASMDWKKWTPRVVVVETWDRGEHDPFLIPKGYERVWRSAENDVYLRAL